MATSASSATCALCANPWKYTCPRCDLKTCSLPCSKAHKTQFSCSGQRDPAKFVSIKAYSQGVWEDDYRWLEEGRRRVASWGEGLDNTSPTNGKGWGGARSKHDVLKDELRKRGIEVGFMAEGMGRRKLNQSSWNQKTQSLVLTVQFSVPLALIAPSTSEPASSSKARPEVDPRIITLTRTPIASSFSSLLPSNLGRPVSDLVLLLPYHSTSSPDPAKGTLYFPPLEPVDGVTLEETLRGTSFIEFPTIVVMLRTQWEMGVEEGSYVVLPKRNVGDGGRTGRDSGWGKKRKAADVKGEEREAKVQRIGGLVEYASEEEDGTAGVNSDTGADPTEEHIPEEHLDDEEPEIDETGRHLDEQAIQALAEHEGVPASIAEVVSQALLADFGEMIAE